MEKFVKTKPTRGGARPGAGNTGKPRGRNGGRKPKHGDNAGRLVRLTLPTDIADRVEADRDNAEQMLIAKYR